MSASLRNTEDIIRMENSTPEKRSRRIKKDNVVLGDVQAAPHRFTFSPFKSQVQNLCRMAKSLKVHAWFIFTKLEYATYLPKMSTGAHPIVRWSELEDTKTFHTDPWAATRRY
jgi:hypothetical protein